MRAVIGCFAIKICDFLFHFIAFSKNSYQNMQFTTELILLCIYNYWYNLLECKLIIIVNVLLYDYRIKVVQPRTLPTEVQSHLTKGSL